MRVLSIFVSSVFKGNLSEWELHVINLQAGLTSVDKSDWYELVGFCVTSSVSYYEMSVTKREYMV